MRTIKRYQGLLAEGGVAGPGSSPLNLTASQKRKHLNIGRSLPNLEKLLRDLSKRKDRKNIDTAPDGGEEEVCTSEGCFTKPSKEALDSFNDPKESREDRSMLELLADLIGGSRDVRQKSLDNRIKRVKNRAEIGNTGLANPFSVLRSRSLQKRKARSEGREDTGGSADGGGWQYIKGSF